MRSPLLIAVLLAALSSPATAQGTANGYTPTPAPPTPVTLQNPDGTVARIGDTVVQGTAVYRGTTLAANTSTQIMAANATRRGFTVQNQTTGNCGVKIGGAAATLDQVSLRIAPGALYETPPHHVSTGAIAVICAAAGGIYATEF